MILMLIFQTCSIGLTQAQSPNVIGRWNVEITFANDNHRSLRFDAQGSGKGTFLLLDPRSDFWEPAQELRRQSGLEGIKTPSRSRALLNFQSATSDATREHWCAKESLKQRV